MQIETRQLSCRVPVKILDEIDRISVRRNLNRTAVVCMILDLGIELHKDLEKVGIVSVVDFAYYVRQSLKEKISASVKKNQISLPI